MLQAILNKSWRQHPTKQQLYGHLPPIMKTIQVRQTRHAGQCWRSRDKLISDVLLRTPLYGQAKAEWPARTYIQQLCADMGFSLEDLSEAIYDRERWRERVKEICADGITWWWHIYIHSPTLSISLSLSLSIYIYTRESSCGSVCDSFNQIHSCKLCCETSVRTVLGLILTLCTLIWFFQPTTHQHTLSQNWYDLLILRDLIGLASPAVDVCNKFQLWRCLWCNGYRHSKWTRWHEFNSWIRLIAFHIALIPLGKVWIQLFSLQLWVNSRTD